MKTAKQLAGYFSAKKQHAKNDIDRAIYEELSETLCDFPDKLDEINALVKDIGA